MIHIGLDAKGERIDIPIHHTGVFGQTGTGKTTLIKEMIKQAVGEGFRVLIFDSKLTQAEFEDMGRPVPFYLEENTDPDVYRSLIEGARTRGRGNMEKFRGGFIELCEPSDGKRAKDFAEIEKRLREKLTNPKIKGYTKSMYSEIYHDHLALNEMLSKHEFAESPAWLLDLDVDRSWSPILRMPIRDLPNLNLQGLVVRSVIEALFQKRVRDLIVVVDEAPNFVNQKLYNPAKSALQQLDSQGRSAKLFGWYTGQTLTGFDKPNMKNLWYWIMGREMERNEVADVFETQTEKVATKDQIKRLKVREFIVSTPDWAKLAMVPKVEQGMTARALDAAIKTMNKYLPDRETITLTQKERAELIQPPEIVGTLKGRSVIRTAPEIVEDSIQAVVELEAKRTTVGAFTLEVTRLQSDSVEAKLLYIVKNKGSGRQAELLKAGLEYGWNISQSGASEALKRLREQGFLVLTGHNDYRLPTDPSFKVLEVAA